MTSKSIVSKQIKAHLLQFFERSELCACRNPSEDAHALRELRFGESSNRMVNGIFFEVDSALDQSSESLTKAISRALGPLSGDDVYIEKTLWVHAAQRLIDSSDAEHAVKAFLREILDDASVSRRYIAESSVVALGAGIDRFNVGPVGLLAGNKLVEELNEVCSRRPLQFLVNGPLLKVDPENRRHLAGVGVNNWDIKIVAAKAHLSEEAAWLAGVAVSLLRLTAISTLGHFVPRAGQSEPHAFRLLANPRGTLTLTGTSVSLGGWARTSHYRISPETLAYCSDVKYLDIVEKLFSPRKGSLGERVKQSLGWQARGRQSEDRAERMLFFFTALEALLSGEDRGAPVVQNIARNASSILTENHDERAYNSRLIKELYSTRSALVHSGVRKVDKRQAISIQQITEDVCQRILDRVTLAESFRDFQGELHDASYGRAWRGGGIHLLPSTASL